MRIDGPLLMPLVAAAFFASTTQAAAATLVAAYDFNNTLTSSVSGAPALGLVDPMGTSGFVSDNVFGQQRTVLEWNGDKPSIYQSGLTFAHHGLLTSDSWSVALTFQFFDTEGWRRILDTSGKDSDAGFYVNADGNLAIYPDSGSDLAFEPGEYRNVVLTVDQGLVNAYIDGNASFQTTSSAFNLGTPDISLFLDDRRFPQEWSAGRIASLSFYDGALTSTEVSAIHESAINAPSVPEPGTWALMIAGFGLVGMGARRNRKAGLARTPAAA